jgi:hypothetical protein
MDFRAGKLTLTPFYPTPPNEVARFHSPTSAAAAIAAALGPRPDERGSQARTRADVSARRPKPVLFDLLTGLIDSWTFWDAVASNRDDGGVLGHRETHGVGGAR